METGQYQANTGTVPDWYRDQPQVRAGEFFIRAFWELSTERPRRGAPIPWNKIVTYGAYCGLDRDVLRVFEHCLREMDEEWLKFQVEDLTPPEED